MIRLVPILTAAFLLSTVVHAESQQDLQARVNQLELVVQDLQDAFRQTQQGQAVAIPASPQRSGSGYAQADGWSNRMHVSGNADVGFLNGDANTPFSEGRWAVENLRLFFDIDLPMTPIPGSKSLFNQASLFFEWDLYREAELENQAGSMYLRLDGLFSQKALNLKVGRMPIPFGEEYQRFHEARPSNPFLSFTASSPYGWDEGAQLFGELGEGRLAYVFSIGNGDNGTDSNSDAEPQWTGRLSVRPTPWAKLSLSALRTGELRVGAWELGGTHLYTVGFPGTGSAAAYQDGVLVVDPSFTVDTTDAWQGDLMLTPVPWGDLWLSFGRAHLRSKGASSFDRDLSFGAAELVIKLAELLPVSPSLYIAGRFSTVGTFDSEEGYKFEMMNGANSVGYNISRADIISAALGYRLSQELTLKAEYSLFDIDLVDGVPLSFRRDARRRDFFGFGLSLGF